jgi:hypothetical protein
MHRLREMREALPDRSLADREINGTTIAKNHNIGAKTETNRKS